MRHFPAKVRRYHFKKIVNTKVHDGITGINTIKIHNGITFIFYGLGLPHDYAHRSL